MQVGYVFSAFLIGYTIFQVPAGVLGDRFGPRLVLTISGLCWGATTLLTGLVPGLLLKGTVLALGSLLVVRFVHGLAEASTYPVAMSAVSEWFAPERHAFISSLIFTGSTLGSAFAPPLVAYGMTTLGWRATFYVSAAFPVVVAALWWRQAGGGKERRSAKSVDSAMVQRASWWRLLRNRNIFLLCLRLPFVLLCHFYIRVLAI